MGSSLNNPSQTLTSNGVYLIKLSDTSLEIWIKNEGNQYVVYLFQLQTSVEINTNVWRVYNVRVTDIKEASPLIGRTETLNKILTTATNVQFEYAFLISGAPDFFGGYHGDEQLQEVLFLVDGKPITAENMVSCAANKFEVVQHTICYDPTDGVTKAGDMYVRHIWTIDGLELKFKFVWAIDCTITSAYSTMFPAVRGTAHTSRCKFMENSTVYTINNAATMGRPALNTYGIQLWNELNNVGIEIEFLDLAWFNGYAASRVEGIWVSDSASYNKVYPTRVHSTQSEVVAAGDVWESDAMYRIFSKK